MFFNTSYYECNQSNMQPKYTNPYINIKFSLNNILNHSRTSSRENPKPLFHIHFHLLLRLNRTNHHIPQLAPHFPNNNILNLTPLNLRQILLIHQHIHLPIRNRNNTIQKSLSPQQILRCSLHLHLL